MLTYVLLVGYLGTAYHGSQLQARDNIATVERELLTAVNALTSADVTSPQLIQWKRTARTDTGVHAVCNVITFRVTREQAKALTLDALTAVLPHDIRVHGARLCRRRRFDAKRNARSRTYRYALPAYVLHTHMDGTSAVPSSPSEPVQAHTAPTSDLPLCDAELCAAYLADIERQVQQRMTQSNTQRINRRKYKRIGALQNALAINDISALRTFADEYQRKSAVSFAVANAANVDTLRDQQKYQQILRNLTLSTVKHYRTSSTELLRLQSFMKQYIGEYDYTHFTTHRRHNNTNVSMIRHVTGFDIESVLLINDVEYIILSITAHSFMINQIRKMIGALIAVMRNALPDDTIRQLLQPISTATAAVDIRVNTTIVPSAPARGLYLLRPTFVIIPEDEIADDVDNDDGDDDSDDDVNGAESDMNEWIDQIMSSMLVNDWRQRVMTEICSESFAMETFRHWCIAVHAVQREMIYQANVNK